MIKIDGKRVQIEGNAMQILEEITIGLRGVYKSVSKVIPEQAAKEIIQKMAAAACMSDEEIEQESLKIFIDIAKKVNADRRED